MSLRGLCNAIACNADVLDAIALFSTPVRFLGPICRLLDSWGHEEDQGRAILFGIKSLALILMLCKVNIN